MGNIRRPEKDELPEDWQPEKSSVQVAIERMEVTDYERDGYDPGAAIRRRWSDTSEEVVVESKDKKAPTGASASADTEAPVVASPNPIVKRDANLTSSLKHDVAAEAEREIDDSFYQQADEEVSQSWPPILSVVLMLSGLLFLILILRRKRKSTSSGGA